MAFSININTAEAKEIAKALADVSDLVASATQYLGGADVDKAYWQGAAASEYEGKLGIARDQINDLAKELDTVSELLYAACSIYRQADGSVVHDGVQLIAAVQQTTAKSVFNI